MMNGRVGARTAARAALLTSAAGFCLVAGAAQAQMSDFSSVERAAQTKITTVDATSQSDFDRIEREPQTTSAAINLGRDEAQLEPQIVIANPNTTVTDRDPNNITGVGQMVVDQGGGYIGLCTATLINPRTVIFAAHCVNEQAANTYGYANGGTGISFGFSNNNLNALRAWLKTIGGSGQTNTANALYNSNYVAYNPLSTEPNAEGFLYGDVAVAALDKPAAGVPTWALLFSALPAPSSIGAAGTGYHVSIEGYGNNGTASTGSTGGIDYRRRIAENMLGGLASLGDFEQFLFGPTGTSNTTNPQNLYWIDFDDPKRGTAGASPYDFNAWRDNAVPGVNGGNSQEGITASGDSGGPLILDKTYAKQLVIGVLSGGYTRFYSTQPANGYGTASFYQPLYLYWDWIAANNPYHYVSAKAGDAKWSDATHWQTNLDPNYYVITGSTVANGIPTTPGAGNTDQPGFGQVCFQNATSSDCYDVATGKETYDPTGHPIGTSGTDAAAGTATNDKASVDIASLGSGDGSQTDAVVSQVSDGTQTSQATLPTPTLANGLPGATNFVPNNFDGNAAAGQAPRYFDVTLSAAGTTTLDTAAVVDNFTLNGASAALNITSTGSLTSNMNVNQILGTMTVDGSLTSVGDYMLMVGGLSGRGTITAPYFTSVAGTIAPGTPTTVGTLTFKGNVILSSGNKLLIDLAGKGSSDLVAVQATTFNGNTPTNGMASLGGTLAFNYTNAVRAGDNYTILTAQGGIGNTRFATPSAISAILVPTVSYTATAVTVKLTAVPYGTVLANGTPIQRAYAVLLDSVRPQQSSYDAVFGPLDLQSAATIGNTLTGLAPTTETSLQSLGFAALDKTANFYRDRLDQMTPGHAGGTLAMIGRPTQVAYDNLSGIGGMGGAGRGLQEAGYGDTTVQENALPETMSAYLAGGYINGDSAGMVGSPATGRDDFDGWYVAGGIESDLDENSTLGFSVSYSKLDGTGALAGQSTRAELWQGTLYGKMMLGNIVALDTIFSAGVFDGHTKRSISFVGTPYTLRSVDHALTLNSEVGLSAALPLGGPVKLTPRAALRSTYLGLTPTAETGGPVALTYYRNAIADLQGRGSLTLSADAGTVRPFVTGTYVHSFEDRAEGVAANFVGSLGGRAVFALNQQDHDWGEVSGGLKFSTGTVDLSVAADTTIDRKDLSAQSYRGSITIHF